MYRSLAVAPSILSADFARLGEEVEAVDKDGADWIHVDVMDGHFVPNLTIGPPVVASLRKTIPDVTFDCHLMIENADEYIPAFAEAGANWISVHQEACVHLDRTLHLIASHNCKPAVVINPATPVHMLDEVLEIVHHVLVMSVNPGFGAQHFIPNSLRKVEELVKIRESRGLAFRIEIDGGVALDTVSNIVRAGAEILVAGNAVFGHGHGDVRENARELLRAARAAASSGPAPRLRRAAAAGPRNSRTERQRKA
jgi:ribulose-phosphate 3-epimerase